jgi:hypothetical protein
LNNNLKIKIMKKFIFLVSVLFLSWNIAAQVSDNFDNYNSGDDPTGWTKYQTETDDPGFIVTGNLSHSSPNSLYHNDDNVSTESTSWIVAPVYTSSGNDLLSLYYQQKYASFYNYSGVWYSTTGSDPIANPGDWTEIVEFNDSHPLSPGFSEDTWTRFTYNFSLPAGTTIYIAFKYVGDYNHEFYVDDFVIDVAPSCMDPDNLSATSTSLTEADLSWNENGTATQWNIEYGPAGFTLGSGTQINGVTSNPYTLTGLNAGEDYDFYVQSDCGSNGTSNWVGPFSWHQMDYGDSCSAPVELTVVSDCSSATPYTLNYAEAVDLGHFSCDQYGANNGKWLSFVAPNSGKAKLVASATGGEIALFDTCGGSEITCHNSPNTYEFEFLDLTPGNTYYIAFWKDNATSGTVDLCMEEILYINPEFDLTANPDCNNQQFNVDVNVTDLGGASSVTVSDDQGSSTQTLSSPGNVNFGPYADGTDVTITVTNNDDSNYASSQHIQYFCPPANDSCAGATIVDNLPYSETMNATGATNNNGFIDCNGSGMNDGVWYKLMVVTASGDITISVDPNGWDPEIAVYSGDCSNLNCIANVDSHGYGSNETLTFTPENNTAYFINVGYYSSSQDRPEGEFTINITGNSTLSNNVLSSEEFFFYPNPANNILHFRSGKSIENVEITDLSGKILMYSENPVTMDISKLPAGIYLLNVYVDNKKGVYRLIKK